MSRLSRRNVRSSTHSPHGAKQSTDQPDQIELFVAQDITINNNADDVSDSSLVPTVDPLLHEEKAGEERIINKEIIKYICSDDDGVPAEGKKTNRARNVTMYKKQVSAGKKVSKLCNISMQVITKHDEKSKTCHIIVKANGI